jgi:hypothetical protein
LREQVVHQTLPLVDLRAAGTNHFSWILSIHDRRTGEDLYPRIRKAILSNRKILNEEQVRNEMFLKLGYYVTESSGHNSEYNWWFRKRPDLIDMVIFRENTEGLYTFGKGGFRVGKEAAVNPLIISRKGTERIVRAAFQMARRRKGAPEDGSEKGNLRGQILSVIDFPNFLDCQKLTARAKRG